MRSVSTGQIRPGMVLAEDVVNRNGTVIVNAGTVLSDKHVRAFKMWGITSVTVESGDSRSLPEVTRKPSRELDEAGRNRLKDLFRFNSEHANHALIQVLIRRAYMRMAERPAPRPSRATPPAESSLQDEDPQPDLEFIIEREGKVASPPASLISLTVLSAILEPSASWPISLTTTLASSSANKNATVFPMPPLPLPVTTADLPFKLILII